MQEPTSEAKDHSIKIVKLIKDQILRSGGIISFADFMRAALYAPSLGYYSAGCEKFGKDGDFITAPMIGSLFGASVAKQCLSILFDLDKDHRNILELGAGDGQLAYQLISIIFDNLECNKYFILEPSAELQYRQKQLLLTKLDTKLRNKIVWLNSLPENFNGIILANEVLDALPVHLFKLENNQVFEKMVGWQDDNFIFKEIIIEKPRKKELHNLFVKGSLFNKLLFNNCEMLTTPSFTIEACLLLPGLIKSLAASLQQGAILLFDYGFLEQEYCYAKNNLGTLRCYYRHNVHGDPFFLPGLQDITAQVNFSVVKEHANRNNLKVTAFSSMANFLMQNGMQQEILKLFKYSNELEMVKLNNEINTLISPNEMGEIFKALLLVKNSSVSAK